MGEKTGRSRRFKPNYLYSVVSTSLVLFMISILAMIFSSGNKLANQFKENLEFTLIIKDGVSEQSILALRDLLKKKPWVKSAVYVSKEEAAKIFMKDSGEEFSDLLDYNPLFASVNLKLLSDYTSQDSINMIEKLMLSNTDVIEFYYEHKLVEVLNDNLRKIGWFIIAVSILLIVIAITLIDSTIRLSMYANRFLIRSMQLVGATRGFITRPFIRTSMINGIISSAIAIGLFLLLMQFAIAQLPELKSLQDEKITLLIFAGIVVIGLLFSYLSTSFAVRKYLRMKLDELY